MPYKYRVTFRAHKRNTHWYSVQVNGRPCYSVSRDSTGRLTLHGSGPFGSACDHPWLIGRGDWDFTLTNRIWRTLIDLAIRQHRKLPWSE